MTRTSTNSGAIPTPTGPVFVPGYQDFALEGCLSEPDGRCALSNLRADENMAVEMCLGFAKGYNYAGVEYGRECWFGNALSGGTVQPAIAAECGMPCSGSPPQYCGPGNRLLLYKTKGYAPPPPSAGP